MSAKFHIIAVNDITSVKICEKFTLTAALIFAAEILKFHDDISIREYDEEDNATYRIIANLSRHGLVKKNIPDVM